ncbi:MAG: hypothetical protein L3J20_00115 [Flavobacteriaceae bacterium]|nr:hypothetical protein [Flavobacteriaceae bacterium]
MNKLIRKLLISISILTLLIVGMSFISNMIIENKIKTILNSQVFSGFKQSFESVKVSSLKGSVSIIKPTIIFYYPDSKVINMSVQLEDFKIDNLSYWNYFIKNTIKLDAINLDKVQLNYFVRPKIVKTNSDTLQPGSKQQTFSKKIFIGAINLKNTDVRFYDTTRDSLLFSVTNMDFSLSDILIDNETVKNIIPANFSSFSIEADSLYSKLGSYETLRINKVKSHNKNLIFSRLNIDTKYSKKGLSKIISAERDHYNISMSELKIMEFDVRFINERFYAKTPKVMSDNLKLIIYRDKLVSDDQSIKPLYSKILRDLSFDLSIDSLHITNAAIVYEEKVKSNGKAGEILFSNLDAKIKNLGNTYAKSLPAKIDINATFMKNTPFKASWSFDVHNINDQFNFSADIGMLHANDLNLFTEPNLNMQSKGQLDKIYFTIDGNKYRSTINMRAKYEHFKIVLLNKKHKKRKLISGILNTLISSNSKKKNKEFKEVIATVKPDKTKSFFNYIWINVKAGLAKEFK